MLRPGNQRFFSCSASANKYRWAGLLLLLTHPLWAQIDQPTNSASAIPPDSGAQDFSINNSLAFQPGGWLKLGGFVDYSYVAPGDAKFRGLKESDSQAQSINAAVAATIPLDDHWYLPVSLHSGNFVLESVAGMPIPDHIDTLRLMAGLGYRINEYWTVSAGLGPALYRVTDIDGDDFGIAGMIGATYRANRDLTVALGIGFNPDNEVPVLPMAGVRWNVQTNLTLNFMFPRPRVIYRLLPQLSVYAGGDIKFAVFRADEDQGDSIGLPQFNNALGTYRDFHLGAGVEYVVLPGLSINAETGYSVGRQIDYTRLHETMRFDPSPYVAVAARYRF